MKTLSIFELQKILQRPFVIAGILLVLALNLLLLATTISGFYAYDPLSGQSASNLAAISLDKTIAQRYSGTLNDAKVIQMLQDFQLTEAELAKMQGVNIAHIILNSTQSAVCQHFAEIDGTYNDQKVADVYGSKPITIGYTADWLTMIDMLKKVFLVLMVLFIAIAAPTFADEYSGTDQLLFTSLYGKTKDSYAKIFAVYLVIMFLTLAFLLSNHLLGRLLFGTESFNCSVLFCPITVTDYSSLLPYSLTVKEVLLYQSLLVVTASIMVTALALLASAFCRSPFIAFMAAFTIFILPFLLPVSENSAFFAAWALLTPIHHIQLLSLIAVKQFSSGVLFAALTLPTALVTAALAIWLALTLYRQHQVR